MGVGKMGNGNFQRAAGHRLLSGAEQHLLNAIDDIARPPACWSCLFAGRKSPAQEGMVLVDAAEMRGGRGAARTGPPDTP